MKYHGAWYMYGLVNELMMTLDRLAFLRSGGWWDVGKRAGCALGARSIVAISEGARVSEAV